MPSRTLGFRPWLRAAGTFLRVSAPRHPAPTVTPNLATALHEVPAGDVSELDDSTLGHAHEAASRLPGIEAAVSTAAALPPPRILTGVLAACERRAAGGK